MPGSLVKKHKTTLTVTSYGRRGILRWVLIDGYLCSTTNSQDLVAHVVVDEITVIPGWVEHWVVIEGSKSLGTAREQGGSGGSRVGEGTATFTSEQRKVALWEVRVCTEQWSIIEGLS